MHGFDILGTVGGTVVFLAGDSAPALRDTALHLRLREAQQQGEMAAQVDAMVREIDRGDGADPAALRHHAGLLDIWLTRQSARSGDADDPFAGRAADRIATAFTALLERDFRRSHRISDYAADLGITATHLSRACRAACGRSASALLHDRLMFEARDMLARTSRPVKDVAASLGFWSASYFTRTFLQRTGTTPTAFRASAGTTRTSPTAQSAQTGRDGYHMARIVPPRAPGGRRGKQAD